MSDEDTCEKTIYDKGYATVRDSIARLDVELFDISERINELMASIDYIKANILLEVEAEADKAMKAGDKSLSNATKRQLAVNAELGKNEEYLNLLNALKTKRREHALVAADRDNEYRAYKLTLALISDDSDV